MAPNDASGTPTEPHATAPSHGEAVVINRRYLVSFIVTLIIVLLVLALLPAALASMAGEMRGQATSPVYDLFTGAQIDPNQTFGPDTTFINITVVNLNETQRLATLSASGHRVCSTSCPKVTATFYSLGSDAARRRGLPPSASVTVPGEPGPYTFTIDLPIRGNPQRYPFDDYTLLLGLIIAVAGPNDGQEILPPPELVRQQVWLTLEDQVARLNMRPPVRVDPNTVRSPSDPVYFLLVDELQWQRPLYLRILSVLLVILISASGLFALGLRSLHELVLGIGGIILGIWGVRSVVVQTPLPDVTLIDFILGVVILVLLLALAARAARYFYVQSGWRWRR
jgi:hypothetical protein